MPELTDDYWYYLKAMRRCSESFPEYAFMMRQLSDLHQVT